MKKIFWKLKFFYLFYVKIKVKLIKLIIKISSNKQFNINRFFQLHAAILRVRVSPATIIAISSRLKELSDECDFVYRRVKEPFACISTQFYQCSVIWGIVMR